MQEASDGKTGIRPFETRC